YLSLATTYTDDPENSHDPMVNGFMRAAIYRLRKEVEKVPSLEDVYADLRANGQRYSDGRSELVEKAFGTLNRARNHETTVAVGVSDEEALCLVFGRADDPKNSHVREKMRQALFDALVDCWKTTIGEQRLVCVHGRVSRS